MGKRAAWKSSWLKLTLALSLALSLQIGLWGNAQHAQAEGAADPAPYIEAKVANGNAGKKVLFDNTHGQTAGAADWVIDGGFSDFGNALANNGYYVKELRKSTPFTYADLQSYDVFVVAEPNIPFKQSEQAAMLQYVQDGGSIFFIGDHYNADRNKNRWDGSESINGYRRGAWEDPTKGMSAEERNSAAMQNVVSSDWLGENFGVRFRYNALGDITANQIVAPQQAFGITQGVSAVAMHAGSTLAIMDPTKAKGIVYLPTTNAAWSNAVDQGVYNGGGIAEGPYAAVSKLGAGKAAFIGDSSPVEDATPKYLREETGAKKTTYDGFKEQDDDVLLVNMVNWLSTKESYTDLTQVNGLQLDQATALHPFEAPAASTEPQAEPWSAPAAGYKWWDPSTFKPGSYGSSTTVTNPAYSFVHQAQLPNAQDFQIRVVIDNLTPNSTVSGFSAGIYLTGGTQVALVQKDDGTWPTAYGYSSTFSLTANAQGRAVKDLTVRLKPGTTGAANLRLRQNGNNLVTKSVTIANVPAEPLPEEENPNPAAISIAEARTKAEGTIVTLNGVVTTEPGAYGGQAFYVQDDTAGIYVFQTASGFHQGDTVKITGALTLYNTELEIADLVSIEKTGTAALPAPAVVAAVDAGNQGQLVEIEQGTIRNIVSAVPAGSFEFDVVNGEVSNHVRVDVRTGLSLTDFPYTEGQVINVKGVSAIFKGVYQLKPRGLGDISLSSVDQQAPVTTATVSPAANANGWVNQAATVTLTSVDDSPGSVRIQYAMNGGSFSDYTGPIAVQAEGVHSIQYFSTDGAGHVEVVKNLLIKLDSIAPVVSLTQSGQAIGDVTNNEQVTFVLSSHDTGSGIASEQLLLDGQAVANGQPLNTSQLSLGAHTIQYIVTDQAGNAATNSYVIQVKNEPVVVDPNTEGAPGKPMLSDNNGHDSGLRDGNYTVTMNMWWGNNGTQFKLYENGVLMNTQTLSSVSPAAQRVQTDITGRGNGTYVYTCELINAYGTTACEPYTVIVTDAAPGASVLSHDNWDGDGTYNITMNMWWGTNASEYRLYENDVLVEVKQLAEASLAAQQALTRVTGKAAGVYEYRCELVNSAGVTSSATITVRVTR